MNLKKTAIKIAREGIEAVKPQKIIPQNIFYNNGCIEIKGNSYKARKIVVVGGGKASGCMAKEVENILGEKIVAGEVNTNYAVNCGIININSAEHPYSGKGSVEGTRRMLRLKKADCDLVIALISGGGSSMIELPQNIPLDKLQKKVKKLIHSGKTIQEINRIRAKFSKIKKGGLAKHFYPKKVVGVILSDVMDNNIQAIASGPTCYKNADNFIFADNDTALEAMKNIARDLGFDVNLIDRKLTGNPMQEAKRIKRIAQKSKKSRRAIIWGGETTPKVKNNGKGGRNQHFAVCFLKIFKARDYKWCFLSMASDGRDFIENVGGGFVKQTMSKTGIDKALKNYDSYDFLKKRDGIVSSENTCTNVGDLGVLLIDNS
ncbi:MAG: DUF4147 domain-containing protein [Candidatus Cloacimonetes bacterium]|nr:DUF4147 domain-containing protein [Candidatus Cloacimonadota bacterium]